MLRYKRTFKIMKLFRLPRVSKPNVPFLKGSALVLAMGIALFQVSTVVKAAVPSITNITVSNITSAAATVTWTTDIASSTQIEYGPTLSYESQTTFVSTAVTTHTQTIAGLQANQKYNFRVKSGDGLGDIATSVNRTFVTALGATTAGTLTDSSNSNTINSTRFTTIAGGQVSSLSVHVGAVDTNVNNRSYQLALYTANGNVPGNLIANTATGTLTANAWNTLPVTANLAANTSYFIGYNSNGSSTSVNNMHYTNSGVSAWRTAGQPFGTWPAAFGAANTQNATFSLYASFVSDSVPPTVSITSPIASSTVTGATTITADAADETALAGVQFKLGSNNLGAPDTTAPYSIPWDTTNYFDGSQTLTAVATDAAGNTTTSAAVTVNTNNPPKLVLTQPTAGQPITGTSVTATYNRAGDWSNGTHVHFRLDSGPTKMDLNGDGDQTYVFDAVADGSHSLEAVVADGSHIEKPETTVTVAFSTVAPDTTPPTVSVTSPANNATVQNTVNVTANAADDRGVVGVQFLLDGTALGSEDTTAPYSVSWDTSTVSNGNHVLTARARDSLNQTTSTAVSVNVQNLDPRAVVGEWGATRNWPLVAVHATLFHTGEILMWDAWDVPVTNAKVWNPLSDIWTDVPLNIPNSELFCAGQATGSNGELVVMGGHSESGTLGTKTIFMFNPVTKAWTRKADMGFARWYPSVTQMADNRMVTFSGQSSSGSFANTPEVFNPSNNTVTQLPFTTPELAEIQYPQTSLIPSGKIMSISSEHGGVMLYNPANSTWNRVGTTPRPYGVWTSYAPGKYLITGGGNTFNDYHDTADDPNAVSSQTKTTLLDMTTDTPVWTNGGDMHQGRSFHNVTMLPTGKALAVGGANIISDFARPTNATLTAEQWDPATNTWAQMAAPANPRMYHSVSILLPDGRVLSAGGGRLAPASDELNAQIYSPPYMFQGPRPTITSAPTNATHNSTMDLTSPNAADISKVTMSTLASVTHTADWNQHFMELSFTRNGNTLTINTPANTAIAPENYYMVFLVNSAGIPSEAKIIKLGAPDTTPPLTANIQATNVTASSATITWNTDETSDTQVDYGTTASYGSSTTLNTTLTTTHSQALSSLSAGTTYHYRVKSRDAAGNLSMSGDQTFTTVAQDTQAPTVSITAPANGNTVSGAVNVTATATDNVNVVGVQFKLDGTNLLAEDTASPHSVSWSTLSATNGSHTLTAVARDAAGNSTTSATVTVTVSNTGGSGPIAAYNFNENLGTVINDLSGNSNTGSIFQALWNPSGKFGSALSFDGSNDYVSVPDANSLDLTNRMTLEAWVRPTGSSAWQTIMLKENGSELAYAMYSRENTNRPSGWVRINPTTGSSTSVTGTTGLALNAWTHLATTYDGTNMRMYVNGTLVGTKARTGTMYNSTGPLKFGGNAVWGEFFTGQIDEVRVYNRALTQPEIQTDMNLPL
jgi:hypothetical protein